MMPAWIKQLAYRLVDFFAPPVVDQRTGKTLGKAFLIPRTNRSLLAGLHAPYVRPVFLPENRVKYGRHRIGFATHEPVDFRRIRPADPTARTPKVLWAILVHQDPAYCRAVRKFWISSGYPAESLLLVHGGRRSDFDELADLPAVFVDDPRLRTANHAFEKQSYNGALIAVTSWLAGRDEFSHVALVEYDQIPLVADWDARLLNALGEENADVLFHHLTRVDGTNAPHYVYELSNPAFAECWNPFSLREDPRVVLNSIGTGSFWKREVWEAVAALPETTAVYLEMYLPSAAHHLGFRVRNLSSQNPFVTPEPRDVSEIPACRAAGAWSLHKVTEIPPSR